MDTSFITDAQRESACFIERLRYSHVVFDAGYLTRRVHVWDGKATTARCWHLLVRREIDGRKLKFCFANAKPQASLRRLASMQADRHFVERAFEDAKSTCGMADYQARGWQAWHHHMALVMIRPDVPRQRTLGPSGNDRQHALLP